MGLLRRGFGLCVGAADVTYGLGCADGLIDCFDLRQVVELADFWKQRFGKGAEFHFQGEDKSFDAALFRPCRYATAGGCDERAGRALP